MAEKDRSKKEAKLFFEKAMSIISGGRPTEDLERLLAEAFEEMLAQGWVPDEENKNGKRLSSWRENRSRKTPEGQRTDFPDE